MRSEINKNEKKIEYHQLKSIMSYINRFENPCFVGHLVSKNPKLTQILDIGT